MLKILHKRLQNIILGIKKNNYFLKKVLKKFGGMEIIH